MNGKYVVSFTDGDPDLCSETVVTGDEAVFTLIARKILSFLRENTYPIERKNEIKALLKALKTARWENVLEPANEFLLEMGNGENFSVRDYEGETDYSEEYEESIREIHELRLSDLIEDENE